MTQPWPEHRDRPMSDSVMPSVKNMTPRELAVFLAVQHHSAACYARSNVTPASKQTVVDTAGFFLSWIEGSI